MNDQIKANRENVFRACDRLFTAGDRITMPAVRSLLGGGSPNSIHRYVHEWEARHRERFLELERRAQQPPSSDVPPELWRELIPIWNQLVAAAKAAGLAAARQEAPPPALKASSSKRATSRTTR